MPQLEPIELPRRLVNRILHLAQNSPDSEVCGLIGARSGVPETCYPVRNIAAEANTRFRMDPSGQIEAMRNLREKGETLFAIFHSHPAAPAAPSPLDLAEASYPEALYIVISLNTKGVLEMCGYRLDQGGGAFNEVSLQLMHE